MGIQIGRFHFNGPFHTLAGVHDVAGVYVTLDRRNNGDLLVLDVGESEKLRTRLLKHERAECWRRNALGGIQVAILATPRATLRQRQAIESEIRRAFAPRCGVR